MSCGKESYSLGKLGEEFVAGYIKQKGYFIARRNYRSSRGEIDIIAENAEYVAFIEVKLRSKNAGYFPREAITKDKKRRLVHAARDYMYKSHSCLIARFDIAEVILNDDTDVKNADLNYFENAFEVGPHEFY